MRKIGLYNTSTAEALAAAGPRHTESVFEPAMIQNEKAVWFHSF